jgi:hypothetical protein
VAQAMEECWQAKKENEAAQRLAAAESSATPWPGQRGKERHEGTWWKEMPSSTSSTSYWLTPTRNQLTRRSLGINPTCKVQFPLSQGAEQMKGKEGMCRQISILIHHNSNKDAQKQSKAPIWEAARIDHCLEF